MTHILQKLLGDDAGSGVDRQLHLTDLLVDLLHEGNDEVHQLVFIHLLRVEVGDEETNVVALQTHTQTDRSELSQPGGDASQTPCSCTSTGFLRRMKKFSALIIMKRMNLWHRIFSISSACRTKFNLRDYHQEERFIPLPSNSHFFPPA